MRPQALKTITTIKTSGARLLNLINDILDAASMRKVGGGGSSVAPSMLPPTPNCVCHAPGRTHILVANTSDVFILTIYMPRVLRLASTMCGPQGKLTIKHEKVNLKRVVDDVIDLCQPLAKRGVKLINELRDNMPFVLGDTGRIIQVGKGAA